METKQEKNIMNLMLAVAKIRAQYKNTVGAKKSVGKQNNSNARECWQSHDTSPPSVLTGPDP